MLKSDAVNALVLAVIGIIKSKTDVLTEKGDRNAEFYKNLHGRNPQFRYAACTILLAEA